MQPVDPPQMTVIDYVIREFARGGWTPVNSGSTYAVIEHYKRAPFSSRQDRTTVAARATVAILPDDRVVLKLEHRMTTPFMYVRSFKKVRKSLRRKGIVK
jgi:hypothetical protein